MNHMTSERKINMNTRLVSWAATATLAWACSPASALVLLNSSTAGNSVAADYSAPGLLSFDIDFSDRAPVTLAYTVEAADLLAPITFNAILRNLTGLGQNSYGLSLSGGTFDTVGSVTRFFGGNTAVGGTPQNVLINFSTPEFFDVQVGNPLGNNALANDWLLNLSGLQVGSTFSITASVPEPSTYALMFGALGLLGWTTARRKSQG